MSILITYQYSASWHDNIIAIIRAFTCSFHMFDKLYTFSRFLAPISTPYVFEAPSLYSTFVFMLYYTSDTQEFGWLVTWLRCVICVFLNLISLTDDLRELYCHISVIDTQ